MPLTEFKQRFRESELRKGIFETLLYYSMNVEKEEILFPTRPRSIFSELIKGTAEFLTGRESDFIPQDYGIDKDGEKIFSTKTDFFEENMWKYFTESLVVNPGKLQPQTEEDLRSLLEPEWSSGDQLSDGEYTTELYEHFLDIPHSFRSAFSLPYAVVVNTERKVIPSLNELVHKDIMEIGRSMRKYIERDLERLRDLSLIS